jgi:hypothetical protein
MHHLLTARVAFGAVVEGFRNAGLAPAQHTQAGRLML